MQKVDNIHKLGYISISIIIPKFLALTKFHSSDGGLKFLKIR